MRAVGVGVSVFGEYEAPLRFSFHFADRLAVSLRAMATAVGTFEQQLGNAQRRAEEGFAGYFSRVFTDNMRVARLDAEEIVDALHCAAEYVDWIAAEAAKENRRRAQVRQYMAEHDDWWELLYDDFFGEGGIPPFAPDVLPSCAVPSPSVRRREHDRRLGMSGGISAAYPENLRSAAQMLIGARGGLPSIERLLADIADFPNQCQYGNLDFGTIPTTLPHWHDLNGLEVTWLETVAQAFEAAGAVGDVSTSLPDAALIEALRVAGVTVHREDLDITSPVLSGFRPGTGYALDPVNVATGNFIEPEVDFAFSGGSASLRLTRMYNSLASHSGVFGQGWMSVLDQRLIQTDDVWTWVMADGRYVSFPAPEGKETRASGQHYWLTLDESGSDPFFAPLMTREEACWVVSDNSGSRWLFSCSGVWLGEMSDSVGIRVERSVDGEVIGLRHQRGRGISFEYVDGHVARALTSDGKHCDYLYDDLGRLCEVRTKEGVLRQYEWDDNSLLRAVTSADGVREVENEYDECGRVRCQRTRFGREVVFRYLPGGVTAVTDRDDSRANVWVSDNRGRLLGVVDADGNRQSMSYDQYGNVVLSRDRAGQETVHIYDQRGRRTQSVLPSGGRVSLEWDAHDRLTTMMTEEGSVLRYVYASDGDRQPCQIIDPLGAVTSLEWMGGLLKRVTDPEGVFVGFEYDEYGDLIATSNPDGAVARIIRDASGRVIEAVSPGGAVTRLTYDDHGHVIEREEPDGAVWRFKRSQEGRLLAVVDPAGAVTTMEYGAHGECVRTCDPLGRVVERGVDDAGNVERLTLPDGAEFVFSFDALSRMREVVSPEGSRWKKDYDAVGRVIGMVDPTGRTHQMKPAANGDSIATVSGDGHSDYGISFDAYGRPTQTSDMYGVDSVITYDAAGRPVEVLDAEGGLAVFRRDRAGRVIEHVAPDGRSTGYTYDACGRVLSVEGPGGARSSFEYDADSRVVARISPLGERSEFIYDVCGRLLEAWVPGQGRSVFRYDVCGRVVYQRDSLTGIRRFSYDAAGQMVKAINGVGGVTRYEYDAQGRVVAIIDPRGGRTVRTYNDLGRVTSVTDPLGRSTTATYDAAGRVLSQTNPEGVTLSFTYDANGAREAVYADGRLLSRVERDLVNRTLRVTDHSDPHAPAMQHSLVYDRMGRLIRKRSDWGHREGIARSVEESHWEYDQLGRRSAYVSPDGTRMSYRYDERGYLQSIDHPVIGRFLCEYDSDGRLVSSTVNGTTQRWEYDQGYVSRHSVVSHDKGQGVPALQVSLTEVERDTWGRIIRHESDGQVFTYEYDDAHQLVSARSAESSQRWDYDEVGRLVRHCDGGRSSEFVYDAASQLTRIRYSNGDYRVFSYDGVGRRVSERSQHGVEKRYSWDERGWLSAVTLVEDSGTSRTIDTHVNALGELQSINESQPWWDSAAGLPCLTGADGVSIFALPGGGSVAEGQVPGSQWRPGRASQQSNPWRAGANSVDASAWQVMPSGGVSIAGLEWMGARLYDPSTTQFVSRDPMVAPAGSVWEHHPYNYAANNPLNVQDPLGLSPVTDSQLALYNSFAHPGGVVGVAGEWLSDNWEYVLGGVGIVAGVALMFTGVGGPAGIALMAASGALISGGVSIGTQKYFNGSVDPATVGLDMLIGGVSGGLGAGASSVIARQGLSRFGTFAVDTASGGFIDGVVDYSQTPGPHSLSTFARSVSRATLENAVTGGIGHVPNLKHVDVSVPQLRPTLEYTDIPSVPRRTNDINVNPEPPEWLDWDKRGALDTVEHGGTTSDTRRVIGRNSRQNDAVHEHIRLLLEHRVTPQEIRLNQQQVNIDGHRVGVNRPDLQFTHRGERYYFEYEGPASTRGPGHAERIRANDPSGRVYILEEDNGYAFPDIFR